MDCKELSKMIKGQKLIMREFKHVINNYNVKDVSHAKITIRIANKKIKAFRMANTMAYFGIKVKTVNQAVRTIETDRSLSYLTIMKEEKC